MKCLTQLHCKDYYPHEAEFVANRSTDHTHNNVPYIITDTSHINSDHSLGLIIYIDEPNRMSISYKYLVPLGQIVLLTTVLTYNKLQHLVITI